ncbi:flavin reductase [Kordiimonas sp. SCSIO 12603]|uniref:flavin reductase family protein n=1 Tax=Kordiimonas sp. SCSIO 12603 TaxID=2829596 RepID=UPI002106DB1E|nr:flavin reductase family protein [Kordiimonas sp. SCSIO 12603]UTW57763.1 flavin reductase [Kordiimonas sp. SCSIO 12603]
MTISPEDFRQGMRRLGGAVNIVTTAHNDVFAGLTATAVTSLSAEPPRLLACINQAGATYEAISKGRCLSVNVLGAKHKELAMKFAGLDGSPETDRFSEGEWSVGCGGAPLLKDALVSFDCVVDNIMDVGSHGIVIGLIQNVVLNDTSVKDPLCYLDGEWTTMVPVE